MSRVALTELVFKNTSPLSVDRGATVYVYKRGTETQATLYAAETGEGTLTQPLTTDSAGRPEKDGVQPWVEPDSYDIVVGGEASPWEATNGADAAVIKEAPLNVQYPEYGATGDGATDDTAAIKKAVAVWKATPYGVLRLPAGHYKVSGLESFAMAAPGQSLLGDGQNATFIEPTSALTGKLINWSCMPASDRPAGFISDLTIDGENAGENAIGLNIGDVVGCSLQNVVIRNFKKTGAVGIEARNIGYWTEEFNWANVTLDNNKTGLQLSRAEAGSTSFGYNTINGLRINAFAGQTGVRLKGDVKLYNAFVRLTGNLHGAGCIGIELAETSQVWGLFAIALETNEAGAVPVKIASGATLEGSGYIHTETGGGISVNSGTENFRMSGYIRLPGIKTGSALFRVAGPVKNVKPASEVTTKELCEALEEVGLVQ